MKFAIRVDAGFHIGTGHVMRCLTIAAALCERSDSVEFIVRAHPGHCYDKLEVAGFPVRYLPPVTTKARQQDFGTGHAAWLGVPAEQDAADTRDILAEHIPDWLIVDHYGIDRHWESRLRESAKRIMVIDDLADRDHDCDLLIDPTLGRQQSDYATLVPAHATLLAGSDYAPLHPAFPARRAQALQDRAERHGRLDRIFISFGSLDPDNYTGPVLEVVRKVLSEAHIDIVLARNAPYREVIQRSIQNDARTMLHCDLSAESMADLMAEADLGIGAAGSTSWERCCLGLPSLVQVIADNQRLIADRLVAAGAAVKFTDTTELKHQLQRLLAEPENLSVMAETAGGITDGRGVQRITEALNQP